MIKVFKDNQLIYENKWMEKIIDFMDDNELQSNEVVIEQPPYIAWHLAKEVDGKRFCTNPYHVDVSNSVVNEWLTREQYDVYRDDI